MARPRTRHFDESVAHMAQSLSQPIRELLELSGADLSRALGVPQVVATAALADALALLVVPVVVRQTVSAAVSQSTTNKSATYQAIADLVGTTRQAIDLRQSYSQAPPESPESTHVPHYE